MAAPTTTCFDADDFYEDDCEDVNDHAGIDDESGDEEISTCSPSQCLFCDSFHDRAEQSLKHVEETHGVPLSLLFRHKTFDFYSFIKVINYFRKHEPNVAQYQSKGDLQKLLVLDDSYMIPANPDDGLLQFDFDSYQERLQRLEPPVDDETSQASVTISAHDYDVLKRQALESTRLKKDIEDLKERYNEDISQLRLSAKRFVTSVPMASGVGDCDLQPSDQRNFSQVHSLKETEDDDYISSYSHYSIHMEMLQDVVRTDGYRQAIVDNGEMFRDKVVLDVGCGTGILSMFAAKSGARQVIGVDISDIIYHAMDIIRENGLQDKITLIKGRIEEIDLPVDKVDIIISEWMGYFLLFESMLDSVIFARRKWLNTDGVVWPNRCDILLTASCDPALRDKNVLFWEDVYGFKMSCMKQEVCKEALVQAIRHEHVVCSPTTIKTVDCCTSDISDLDFTSTFSLTVDRNCTVHAIIGFFDTFFDADTASTKVTFSTGAHSKTTHWKQTVFLLSNPLNRLQGEHISGTIDVRKLPKDPRSLQVKIKVDNITYKYTLS